MRRTPWFAVILVIVIGSGLGIAGGSFLAKWMSFLGGANTSPWDLWKNPFGGETYVRFLMIGEDDTSKRNSNGNGLSDTLVVFAIDTTTKDIRAISIPRDTRVEIPGHGVCKINAANVYGGPELVTRVVGELLETKIDYYVKTNTEGLRNMVDMVGGIYLKIDENMKYVDRRGNLHINLKASPEKQLLNGRQAEGYVRFRHDRVGDYGWKTVDGKKVPAGRVVRQQNFMRALANRILAMESNEDRARFLSESIKKKYVVTNLNLVDWKALADWFKDIDPAKIKMAVMPGDLDNIGGGSYVVPDTEELRQVVEQNLFFQDPVDDTPARIEVLNGSGIAGAAGKVADALEAAGFEVIKTGNAPRFGYEHCCVIARNGNTEQAQVIAKHINCADVRHEPGSDDALDVTVIVGRDFQN